MTDLLNKNELTPQTETKLHTIPMRTGIVSIIMFPLSIFFFYDRAALFGYAFYFGAIILGIFGLVLIKQYKGYNPFINDVQIKKIKTAKVVCLIGTLVPLIIILIFLLILMFTFESIPNQSIIINLHQNLNTI